jgi:hypothetical protein
MRHVSREQRLREAFAKLPLAAQFVLALSALIIAGFAVALAVMTYADYERTHWTPDRAWVLLAIFSVVTAAALIRAFKRKWRRVWFWVTLSGVMLVRTAIYVAALRQFPGWPVGLFAVLTMGEIQVLVPALYWLNYGAGARMFSPDRRRRRPVQR